MDRKNPLIIIGLIFSLISCAPTRTIVWEGKEMPLEEAARLDFSPAEKAFSLEKYDEAQRGFKLVVERYPESRLAPLALLRQGQIEFKRDNLHDAVSFFSHIIERYPGSPEALEARLQLAFCDHRLGLFDDAIQILKGLLDEGLDPDKESLALYTIGEAFGELNRHLDSLRWFIRAWKAIPDPLFREATGETIKEIALTKLTDEELEKISDENKGAFPGDIATFQLSLRYLDARKYEQAGKWFKEFLSTYSSHELAPKAKVMLSRIERRGIVKRNSLGVVLPLSGKFGAFGEKALKGIELAARVFDPGQKDPIELVIRDSKGVPSLAGEAVEELVFDEGVQAIVGPLLSVTSEAAAFRAQDLGVPMISLSQKEGLTQIGENILRNSVLPSQQARALVGYAMDSLGLRTFAILYPRDPYGEELMRAVIEEVQARGGEVKGAEGYETYQTDFGEQIKKLVGLYYLDLRDEEKKEWMKQRKEEIEALKERGEAAKLQKLMKEQWEPPPMVDFEALVIPDYYDKVVLIAPQLAYYDVVGVQLLGSHGWNSPKLLELGGRYVDGAVFVDGFFKDSKRPEVRAFVEDFRKEFSEDPDILSALAYDSVNIIMSVVRSGGVSTREDLRQKLSVLRNYKGVTGLTSFGASGEVDKSLGLYRIEGRHIEEIEAGRTHPIPTEGPFQRQIGSGD